MTKKVSQQRSGTLHLRPRREGLPRRFPEYDIETPVPAGHSILRRFRSSRESKHFRKGHVPVQHMILGGEMYDGRRRGGWYALWSQVQPAPGIVGDCWQCLARLGPEKRGTPGIREQTCWLR